jgi:UDP-N-acetyl-D-galactosamine dehydrogenase
MPETIAVIGLGYVGLPVAVAFGKKLPNVIGFDIDKTKIGELRDGHDRTGEISAEELQSTNVRYTCDIEDLKAVTFYIVAVPTPIDESKRPDLRPLERASETIGKAVQPGSVVVYESTVYPGVTEDVCGPILERVSGLKRGVDFKLGYSPERINPGDKEHTLQRITKVVSGEDAETLERVASTYEMVVDAGVHRAPSIKVAEAAKVIENTQRDLNIALMNELSLIFDLMDIRTPDVLAAAGTKWNFLPFRPGLVGGHCIGVDPYYLTSKAEEMGYHPQVILAGRSVNDGMGKHVAQRMIKLLIGADVPHVRDAKVGILGLTFKEDVPDLRNSRVPDIVKELREFGIEPVIHDAMADCKEAKHEYGIELAGWEDMQNLDGLIVAVSHKAYRDMPLEKITGCLNNGGVVIDVKNMLDRKQVPGHLTYWCL